MMSDEEAADVLARLGNLVGLIVYLDKARIQPALGDVWHRVAEVDFVNGVLTTLCGEEGKLVFECAERRPPLKTCWDCDSACRRAMRIARAGPRA